MTKQQLELLDELMNAKIKILRSQLDGDGGDTWWGDKEESVAYNALYKLTEDYKDE
jgi:phage gp46-like protein